MAMNSALRIFVAFASMLIVPTTLAQSPARLEVIVFPGGFNWPIWVAQEKGFFRENGVEVNITPTPGSVFQLVNLIDGKFDVNTQINRQMEGAAHETARVAHGSAR